MAPPVVLTKYPLPATAVKVLVFTSDVCQSIAPKPVAVPLLEMVPAMFNVAPEGNVIVSPDAPTCKAVPD